MSVPLAVEAELARDARRGLTQPQKQLSAKYLYDELGSALFEAITYLPEYGLTRADGRLLERHAPEIVNLMPQHLVVAELGSGSAVKSRSILEAQARRAAVDYFAIDISNAALARCRQELAGLRDVTVHAVSDTYLPGLERVERNGASLLVLFLGSTIGNFDRESAGDFLRRVRNLMRPGDALLLGADLVKPIARMLLAYDDPLGLTAVFNKNVLARLNRELGANFNLSRFRHRVRYDRVQQSIEMHLESTRAQSVSLPGASLEIELRKGETIWTEASHKFKPEQIIDMARRAGFVCERQWIDEKWPFAESLFRA